MRDFRQPYKLYQTLLVIVLTVISGGELQAVTQFNKQSLPFSYEISSFYPSLFLPLNEKIETIHIPETKVIQRLKMSPENDTIEPLTVILSGDEPQIMAVAEKLAKEGQTKALADYLRSAYETSKIDNKSKNRSVTIDAKGFAFVDPSAYGDLYNRTHHNLALDTSALKRNPSMYREFIKQLSPFFLKNEKHELIEKIKRGESLAVDTDLLPEFPRKMVKKYLIYRGPNCFHAALAFHSPKLTNSSLVNVKDEQGYHRAMINYDELWRAINHHFYEIDPQKVSLNYGDMIVFFEVPSGHESMQSHKIDFHWIRHAATYLFNGYTFSKGSKSPNTPYTVRTLDDEFKTWKRYTTNLGIKVFRRSLKNVKKHPPMDLSDWMY